MLYLHRDIVRNTSCSTYKEQRCHIPALLSESGKVTTQRRKQNDGNTPPFHGWKGCEAHNILFPLVLSKVQHPVGINVPLEAWIKLPLPPMISVIFENLLSTSNPGMPFCTCFQTILQFVLISVISEYLPSILTLFPEPKMTLIANQKWRPATRPRLMIPCAWSHSPLPVPLSSAANERPEAFLNIESSLFNKGFSSVADEGFSSVADEPLAIEYFTQPDLCYELDNIIKVVEQTLLRFHLCLMVMSVTPLCKSGAISAL